MKKLLLIIVSLSLIVFVSTIISSCKQRQSEWETMDAIFKIAENCNDTFSINTIAPDKYWSLISTKWETDKFKVIELTGTYALQMEAPDEKKTIRCNAFSFPPHEDTYDHFNIEIKPSEKGKPFVLISVVR